MVSFTLIFFPFREKKGKKNPPPVMFLKALNLLWSLQLCRFADFLSLSPGRAKLWGHEGPSQYGVVECCGWMAYHIIEYHIWSTLQSSTRMLYFVVFFFLTFAVLLGNSRTSPVFILLLLLEIQQRNISLNYASFKWADCLLSYVYAYLFLLLSSTCNNLILLIFGSLYNYSTMRFRFWKQLSKQDGKSFPGISVKVTSNPVTTVSKIFTFYRNKCVQMQY